MGNVNFTKHGFACLPWTSAVNTRYRNDSYFADGSVAAAGSFCRNPRGPGGGMSSSRPWCYVEKNGLETKLGDAVIYPTVEHVRIYGKIGGT